MVKLQQVKDSRSGVVVDMPVR